MSNSSILSASHLAEIQQAFNLYANELGFAPLHSPLLRVTLRALSYDPTPKQLLKMTEKIEKRILSNQLSFGDYCEFIKERMLEKDTDDDLIAIFDGIRGNKETIGLEELMKLAEEVNENIPEEELKQMIKDADLDQDGRINKHEFLHFYHSFNN
jgi:Ca2+-binding EF-hand superfamily protein